MCNCKCRIGKSKTRLKEIATIHRVWLSENLGCIKLMKNDIIGRKKLERKGKFNMAKKNQSTRLTDQHKDSQGVVGIFGDDAKSHDVIVGEISKSVISYLKKEFPILDFRYRKSITKEEINKALKSVDPELGQTLFVSNSSIKPDGGIIEVKDDNNNWRIVLVSEAKHQGKDIENMLNIMLEISKTSLQVLGSEIFKQITKSK